MSTVLTRPERTDRQLTGRHRLGRPGLIPVTALVTIARRGFFRSLFRSGRHRAAALPAARRVRARVPVSAAV